MKTPDHVMPSIEGRKCIKCGDAADVKKGTTPYCARHYRFLRMRDSAATVSKSVPSYEWLEANVPEGMVCPCCKRTMNWLRKEGGPTVITLQHDRDGEGVRLMCHSCNIRHSKMPKDSFYDLPAGHKWCPRCDEIKPVEEFYTTPGSGRISECRPCNKVMRASHSEANRERLSAKAKDYYIENRERILARIKARQQERHALSSGRVSK